MTKVYRGFTVVTQPKKRGGRWGVRVTIFRDDDTEAVKHLGTGDVTFATPDFADQGGFILARVWIDDVLGG